MTFAITPDGRCTGCGRMRPDETACPFDDCPSNLPETKPVPRPVIITHGQTASGTCYDCHNEILPGQLVMERRGTGGDHWGTSYSEVPVHADRRMCVAARDKWRREQRLIMSRERVTETREALADAEAYLEMVERATS